MKIAVLGAGLVGAPMVMDLAKSGGFEITVADLRDEPLTHLAKLPGVTTTKADLSKRAVVEELAEASDLVLSAVPGFMGYATLETVLAAGKSCVDIAFFAEDPLTLDALAKKNGVTAIVDMGVFPGMGSVLAGHAATQLDSLDTILTYVGGLPRVRTWPYEYKAVFSPIDVIEEYVRPARYVENGRQVVRPALSDPEYIDFPGLGTLEAFNTDGLRTMAKTMSAPNMKEKTLRYPGHIEKMAVLRETGFFRTDPVDVGGGVMVRPIDMTAKLLFPMWKMQEGDVDVTVLRVIVEGKKAGAGKRYTYDMTDAADPVTGVHSMARTTGYTATSAIRMMKRGLFSEKGVFPPELVGRHPACTAFLLDELKQRGVVYDERVESI